jgi:hypothetical protein
LGALFVAACGGGGGQDQSAQSGQGQVPSAPQVTSLAPRLETFVDATAASGIAYQAGFKTDVPPGENPTIVGRAATSSVAAGDYDGDGDVDLFVTRGDIGPNLLYRNNGVGVFAEVAAGSGLAFTATATENYRHSAATFADMDGDGDLDLFIGGLFGDPSFIYANNGDGTFSDVTSGSGIDTLEAEHTVSAAFGDYDLDGDLDMFLSHWGTHRDPDNPGDTEHLWRNDSGGGTIVFTSVSEPAGISPSIITLPEVETNRWRDDWTFTPTFARIDDDLYPDILIAADFGFTQFFSNDRDGTFTNATDKAVLRDRNGMGSAVGDYDNDGDLDWFVTSIFTGRPLDFETGNYFYENDNGTFVSQPPSLGVAIGGWGWGTCFMDFENDGDLDIYQTNGWDLEGFEFDVSLAFEGSGGGPFFDNASALGLDDMEMGRGVVCADFDNDGDVDIFQLHLGSPGSATMWRNDSSGNNYLRIKLNGLPPNTEAAGARIYVTVGEVTQMREVVIGNNYVSQNPTIQVFGLGSAAQADEVRVQWPDGLEAIDTAVAAGQTLMLDHPKLERPSG